MASRHTHSKSLSCGNHTWRQSPAISMVKCHGCHQEPRQQETETRMAKLITRSRVYSHPIQNLSPYHTIENFRPIKGAAMFWFQNDETTLKWLLLHNNYNNLNIFRHLIGYSQWKIYLLIYAIQKVIIYISMKWMKVINWSISQII